MLNILGVFVFKPSLSNVAWVVHKVRGIPSACGRSRPIALKLSTEGLLYTLAALGLESVICILSCRISFSHRSAARGCSFMGTVAVNPATAGYLPEIVRSYGKVSWKAVLQSRTESLRCQVKFYLFDELPALERPMEQIGGATRTEQAGQFKQHG